MLVGALAMALVFAACAGERVEAGVYHSKKGYRVTVPSGDWEVVNGSRADLELRHRRVTAAMLVNASCDPATARRDFRVLRRHILPSLRDREIVEQGTVMIDGHEADHAVLEGQATDGPGRVRIELYLMKNERCVYDFLYASTPGDFATGQEDFRRLVETFADER